MIHGPVGAGASSPCVRAAPQHRAPGVLRTGVRGVLSGRGCGVRDPRGSCGVPDQKRSGPQHLPVQTALPESIR